MYPLSPYTALFPLELSEECTSVTRAPLAHSDSENTRAIKRKAAASILDDDVNFRRSSLNYDDVIISAVSACFSAKCVCVYVYTS